MQRATISKTVLDALIRAKLDSLDGCKEVDALPVVHKPVGTSTGCNWTVPGWVGESGMVRTCVEKLNGYLQFLQSQFNIPSERDRVK